MPLRLSKSKYCNAVQCPKMLWLHKNKPEEFDNSVMNDDVLETGNQVGDLAMGLFGDFTEVLFGDLGDITNSAFICQARMMNPTNTQSSPKAQKPFLNVLP